MDKKILAGIAATYLIALAVVFLVLARLSNARAAETDRLVEELRHAEELTQEA